MKQVLLIILCTVLFGAIYLLICYLSGCNREKGIDNNDKDDDSPADLGH